MTEPNDFPDPPGTLVILYPRDWQKFDGTPDSAAFNGIPAFVERARARGINVKLIGDGTRVLSLDEVKRELEAVRGPAALYIAAHGGEPDLPGLDHNWDGFSYGSQAKFPSANFFNRALFGGDFIAAEALFRIVPPNYKTVIDYSCQSGTGIFLAQRYLPNSTQYLPISNRDLGSGGGETYLTFFALDNAYTASDLYLQLVLSTHSRDYLGLDDPPLSREAFSQLSPEKQREYHERRDFYRLNQRNLPTQIAVGDQNVLDLGAQITAAKGHRFTETQFNYFAATLKNVILMRYPITLDDQNNGREDEALSRGVRETLHSVARRIETGAITPRDPDYGIALAMFYQLNILKGNIPLPVTLISRSSSDHQPVLSGYSKFERELHGLLQGADRKTQIPYRTLSLLRNLATNDYFHEAMSVSDMTFNLAEILRSHGITRIEQIGNGDDELTAQEFNDLLPRLLGEQARRTPPRGRSH
jgi:hypothetical protein